MVVLPAASSPSITTLQFRQARAFQAGKGMVSGCVGCVAAENAVRMAMLMIGSALYLISLLPKSRSSKPVNRLLKEFPILAQRFQTLLLCWVARLAPEPRGPAPCYSRLSQGPFSSGDSVCSRERRGPGNGLEARLTVRKLVLVACVGKDST